MSQRERERILLLDGYIDSPGCLGVPPYLSPLARYIFGAFCDEEEFAIRYLTVDQFRTDIRTQKKQHPTDFLSNIVSRYQNYDIIIYITGVSVPGKYLGGRPIRFSELRRFPRYFPDAFQILCGPATVYGIGEEGGKPSVPVENLAPLYDAILYGDPEVILAKLVTHKKFPIRHHRDDLKDSAHDVRPNMEFIKNLAIQGAAIVTQHPNFSEKGGGNLICEIETFRGCPRYKSGGCAFCIEPSKGQPQHRTISSILREFEALYDHGVRHFRIGSQTDFYAYLHGNYDFPRYPRPNPEKIETLLKGIRELCPDIRTLHIDNVNALNFVLYPEEAGRITEIITEYCTPGNIAALGIESVDPNVVQANNLKGNANEMLKAIEIINHYGNEIGKNGCPKFLPGLNFIMGLPGETKDSLDLNSAFLNEILTRNLQLRRINLRKFLVPSSFSAQRTRKITKHLRKNVSRYFQWKKYVRTEIDLPMLKIIFPFGRILKDVYAEKHDGKGTLLRQVGTYPITCFVPKVLQLSCYYDLVIVNHGFRSLTCLVTPLQLTRLTQKELEAIDGIGKKRAMKIQRFLPRTLQDWKGVVPEIWEKILVIQPSISENEN